MDLTPMLNQGSREGSLEEERRRKGPNPDEWADWIDDDRVVSRNPTPPHEGESDQGITDLPAPK